MARTYRGYRAHELRRGVIHASDDGLIVLLGDLSFAPSQDAVLRLEFPAPPEHVVDPTVELRFVPAADLPEYLARCDDGEQPYPRDLDPYLQPAIDVERRELEVDLTEDRPGRFERSWRAIPGWTPGGKRARIIELEQRFRTEAGEGAYLVVVRYQSPVSGVPAECSVVIYSKPRTFFPTDHDGDLADLLGATVNLSRKNGFLWFVHPIYFAEQLLNVKLAPEVIREMVNCDGLPADLPARDEVLVPLQWGFGHQGLRKVRLDVDPPEEPEPCIDREGVRIKAQPFDAETFLRKAAV